MPHSERHTHRPNRPESKNFFERKIPFGLAATFITISFLGLLGAYARLSSTKADLAELQKMAPTANAQREAMIQATATALGPEVYGEIPPEIFSSIINFTADNSKDPDNSLFDTACTGVIYEEPIITTIFGGKPLAAAPIATIGHCMPEGTDSIVILSPTGDHIPGVITEIRELSGIPNTSNDYPTLAVMLFYPEYFSDLLPLAHDLVLSALPDNTTTSDHFGYCGYPSAINEGLSANIRCETFSGPFEFEDGFQSFSGVSTGHGDSGAPIINLNGDNSSISCIIHGLSTKDALDGTAKNGLCAPFPLNVVADANDMWAKYQEAISPLPLVTPTLSP